MPEHEPLPHHELDEQAVGKALRTRPATVRDVAYGEGYQFSTGRGAVRLEVYPRNGVTRLTTQDVRVELFGSAQATVYESGVEFARVHPREEASLTVLSDAGVVFTFIAGGEQQTAETPQQAPRAPQTEDPHPDRAVAPSESSQALRTKRKTMRARRRPAQPEGSVESSTPPPHTQDANQAAAAEPNATGSEARERGTLVRFTGRLGQDPFISDRRGASRVRLSVGEHYEDADGAEKTRWHEVWAASANSEAVKRLAEEGTLRRGAEVRIRGYEHERGPDAQGKPQRPFVRAFQIEPVKKLSPRQGKRS